MVNVGDSLSKVSADLRRMIREFNVQPIETIKDRLPKNRLVEQGILIAHRDFDKVLDDYKRGKKFAIVSGRGPSGPMHIGHLFLFSVVKYLQSSFNVDVYIPLSDDEKFVFGKIGSLGDGEFWARDNARVIMALGFDPKKTHIYISSKQNWVYRYALEISKKLTISTVKSALGIEDSVNIGVPFYAAVQIAHILQPTIEKGLRVVVPIGLDQDVFMRLTRDVAEKLGLPKPASLYIKFIPGLSNEPMSSSKPESAIFVNDDDRSLLSKIFSALTGGKGTIEEQRREGADPSVCNVFAWLNFFVIKSNKQREDYINKCKSGEILCGFDCKLVLYRYMRGYLNKIRRIAESMDINNFLG
ncbi:MAG: tryptophan--tRNA ligase [Candidatus Njordarchaeia archaeon]